MTRPSWIGQTLDGRYRIDDILGQGGMSAVYKAYDPNLKRVVALKMIHAHLADDPKFVSRFMEEAAAVAQLRHPNIVQVYDFNHDDNLYYMVQEFVEGETLQERLRRLNKNGQRMPLSEAIGYILNICDAAGYAHQRGLVHRDIKPANIMIDSHRQAILMDFGIVKIAGGEKHTETGAVVGTALYLPPELIVGETPDPRSDEYSLGITLFEAVSGRPPFEADSAMTLMMMHLNDPVPDLRQLRSDVPAVLVAVIAKALEKKRENRYASMAEFAAALRGVLSSLNKMTPAATLAEEMATGVDGLTPAPEQTPLRTAVSSPSGSLKTSAELPASEQRSTSPEPFASSAVKQPPARKPLPSISSKSSLKLWLGLGLGFGGIALVGIVLIILLLRATLRSETPVLAALASPTSTETLPPPTSSPTPIPTNTSTPTITPTSPPTATPTVTLTPVPPVPAGILFSRINKITLNDQGFYVVDYETFEFTEKLPGIHVHFFFDTVSQDQAGSPGKGPWKLYGGPRPFTGYAASSRPEAATQMCVRVANADHSIQPDSGNCFFLPDVHVAAPYFNDPCYAGPDQSFPIQTQLTAGQVLRVKGISSDEAWWAVAQPDLPGQTCWLRRDRSSFSGNLSTLPLAEAPASPANVQAGMSVTITSITLDSQGHYVVEFTPQGFTPALPGTHMHFFFDVFASEQVGSSYGKRFIYGGPSPFGDYTQADRPPDSKQLCVLVANPDHSVIEGSGNCFPLPEN